MVLGVAVAELGVFLPVDLSIAIWLIGLGSIVAAWGLVFIVPMRWQRPVAIYVAVVSFLAPVGIFALWLRLR